jgi:hypothetical protein
MHCKTSHRITRQLKFNTGLQRIKIHNSLVMPQTFLTAFRRVMSTISQHSILCTQLFCFFFFSFLYTSLFHLTYNCREATMNTAEIQETVEKHPKYDFHKLSRAHTNILPFQWTSLWAGKEMMKTQNYNRFQQFCVTIKCTLGKCQMKTSFKILQSNSHTYASYGFAEQISVMVML